VLVHGDSGPGNFLHDGHHLTGVLDWELSDWGDPMDDLAWWWFRETLHPVRTDLASWYRRYAEQTGRSFPQAEAASRRLAKKLLCTATCSAASGSTPCQAGSNIPGSQMDEWLSLDGECREQRSAPSPKPPSVATLGLRSRGIPQQWIAGYDLPGHVDSRISVGQSLQHRRCQ
jgi:hypothetical protein